MNTDYTTTKYEDALQPKMFDCCGWQLKPFCLGHYVLLEKLGSPVVNLSDEYIRNNSFTLSQEEQMEKLTSFFTAVMICSLDYNLASKVLNDNDFLAKITKKFTEVLLKDMERPNWNYPREFYVFQQYTKYYFDVPMFDFVNSQKEAPSGTDWKQNMFVLFKKLGYSELEILNMAFNKLFLEWASEAESSGNIKVLNKFEVEQVMNPSKVMVTTKEST